MSGGLFRDNRLTCCANSGSNTDGLLYASGGTVERMLIDCNKASNDYIHYHNHGTVYISGIGYGDIAAGSLPTVFKNNCATTTIGANCITDDPLFMGTGTRPYQILGKFPFVVIGFNDDWMETATDFYGNPRLIGSRVDIGAAEAATTSTVFLQR